MKKGQLDMMGYSGCPPIAVDTFKDDKNIKIIVSPNISLDWLIFNLHKDTPLQDVNVRRAIMHGIDRKRIVQMVYLGYAQPHDSFIYPEMEDYNAKATDLFCRNLERFIAGKRLFNIVGKRRGY